MLLDHLKNLLNSPDFNEFRKAIESEILEPIKLDLITHKYTTLEDRNVDSKVYKKIKDIIDFPENYIYQKEKSPRINTTEIYD
jgi:hypothetical protein